MNDSEMYHMTRSTFVSVGDSRCAEVYVRILGVFSICITVMMRNPEGKNGLHYFHWLQCGQSDAEHPEEYGTLDEAIDAAEAKIRAALSAASKAKIEVDI